MTDKSLTHAFEAERPGLVIAKPRKSSEWTCYLFGRGSGFIYRPLEEELPNVLHRAVQRFFFGFIWVKDK